MKDNHKSIFSLLMARLRRLSNKAKVLVLVASGIVTVLFIRLFFPSYNSIFVAAESVHAVGISVLIYKLLREKNCAGLSLKSQELTAIFLAVRLYCSFIIEYDIHTMLDAATLCTTLWVIYTIRFNLKSTYMKDKDDITIYYVIIPCFILALIIHPTLDFHIFNRICWAFCIYLEAVSVFPQLKLMQNTKIVETFTAHYVFALGLARFFSCAHWIIQVIETKGGIMTSMGRGLWPLAILLAEIVQTFILADFCYYYAKSVLGGHLIVRLPSGVV